MYIRGKSKRTTERLRIKNTGTVVHYRYQYSVGANIEDFNGKISEIA